MPSGGLLLRIVLMLVVTAFAVSAYKNNDIRFFAFFTAGSLMITWLSLVVESFKEQKQPPQAPKE